MHDPRVALRHVLWIGGPPDAGKSTVANLLGGKYGLPVYHFDRHERDHIARADPQQYPRLYELRRLGAAVESRKALEERWVRRPPEEMAQAVIASWSERVGLAVEDLLALPAGRPIIAEGPAFFPAMVLPLLADPRQAIWLVPSEAFKRASHERRGKSTLWHETSDPERATRNHITRDLLIAEHYRRTVQARGLPLIEVDGSQPPEEVAAAVEAHFGSFLGRATSAPAME